jgi:hypothetical protein
MFRQLLIFPSSVDAATVERIVTEEVASFYDRSQEFVSLSLSVGPLMGPAARDGGAGVVVEAVFRTLESSLATIMAPEFASTKATVEALGAQIYLYEAREL